MDKLEDLIKDMVARAIAEAADFRRPRWVNGWKDISAYLHVTPQTAIKWADRGVIKIHRKGRAILADLNELDKCIKRL